MTPVLILQKGGVDLMPGLDPYFLSATFADSVGGDNDSLTVELDDEGRQLPLPQEDDLLIALAGYRESSIARLGAFKVQGWESGWESGPETMTMTARAATYTGKVKAGGLKHWDDKPLGDILKDTATAAGLQISIDPALAQIKVPYALRWEASPIDFATRIAEEFGGVVKPGGEKLAVIKRGSGKGASGAALPVIRIQRLGCSGWRIKGEPRPRHGDIAASWHNPKTGKRTSLRHNTGRKGPIHTLTHPRASEDEAKRAAEARARDLTMATGGGHFVVPFDPGYSAGAIVEASGFGEGIDGRWVSETIATTWRKGSPVLSRITVKADPEKKG